MAIDDGTSVTTKLLTLLNVSATRVGKRKIETEDFVPAEKLNKRRSISFSENVAVRLLHAEETNPEVVETERNTSKPEEETMEVDEDVEVEGAYLRQLVALLN